MQGEVASPDGPDPGTEEGGPNCGLGFFGAYLRVYPRVEKPFAFAFDTGSIWSAGDLYLRLWSMGVQEPFSETRLLFANGRVEIADWFCHFASDLSAMTALALVSAFIRDRWVDVVYVADESIILRLLIDPDLRTPVPYPDPYALVDGFDLAAVFRNLNRAYEIFCRMYTPKGETEEPDADTDFLDLPTRAIEVLALPRRVLRKKWHDITTEGNARRGDTGVFDGVLLVLQRVGLLSFVGPPNDPLLAIKFLESQHPVARAIQTARERVVDKPLPRKKRPVADKGEEEAEAEGSDDEEWVEFDDGLGEGDEGGNDTEGLGFVDHFGDELTIDDDDWLDGEELETFHARLDAFAFKEHALSWYEDRDEERGTEEPDEAVSEPDLITLPLRPELSEEAAQALQAFRTRWITSRGYLDGPVRRVQQELNVKRPEAEAILRELVDKRALVADKRRDDGTFLFTSLKVAT